MHCTAAKVNRARNSETLSCVVGAGGPKQVIDRRLCTSSISLDDGTQKLHQCAARNVVKEERQRDYPSTSHIP